MPYKFPVVNHSERALFESELERIANEAEAADDDTTDVSFKVIHTYITQDRYIALCCIYSRSYQKFTPDPQPVDAAGNPILPPGGDTIPPDTDGTGNAPASPMVNATPGKTADPTHQADFAPGSGSGPLVTPPNTESNPQPVPVPQAGPSAQSIAPTVTTTSSQAGVGGDLAETNKTTDGPNPGQSVPNPIGAQPAQQLPANDQPANVDNDDPAGDQAKSIDK